MPLPRQLFVQSFRHHHLGRFFAVLVGIMVFFATFAMTAEATIAAVSYSWNGAMAHRLTVEIPATGDESSLPQVERIKQAVSILRAMPGIATVRAVPDEETFALLKPWIDQPELLKSLPVPSLIDVQRTSDSRLTADDVRDQLRDAVHDVRIDDHSAWLADFGRLARGMAVMGAMMIVLAAAILIIAVSLLSRAIMATERETISLLHVMGAEDNDIAHQFERHTRRLAVPAAAVGFVLAVLGASLLLFLMRHFVDPSSMHFSHWLGLSCAVTLVPLVAIGISSLSARLSVLNFLYAMP